MEREKVIEDYKESAYYQGNGVTLGFEGLVGEYISTTVSIMVSTTVLYFAISTFFYVLFFHLTRSIFLPKYKGKLLIMQDVLLSLWNIAGMSFFLSLWTMLQPRYSLMYYDVNDHSYAYYLLSILLHMIVDETGL